MIGMLYAMWFLDGTPVYMLVDGSAIQSTFLTAAIFMIFLMSFRGLLSIYRLRRNLLEGKPMNHHAPWKRQHRINTIFQRIYISISIVVIILGILQLTTGQNKTLPSWHEQPDT